ncbi:MAG: pyrroline-5-carboxylate reductase [Erysipelotrichaceae bacterium]|nr:pyrroline-5-carboxylate reductase [Erysipelotrichaceae bacterium]MBQ9987068.1 pyrroline-5-carboxylate reductase [Erysipelotrichales bacterium]MBR3694454.1 pyrroline-5-carboxylate reductase [Erysipelotrichales bacterium]
MMNWNIGVIGFGNIAQAMMEGLLKVGAIEPSKVHVCAAHYDKLCRNAAKYGFVPHASAEEVIVNSDLVILAVKPYQMEKVVTPLQNLLQDKIVTTVASKWTFDKLETVLAPNTRHVSITPNTPVAVAEGIIIMEDRSTLTVEEQQEFKSLLEKIALVVVLDQEHMGIAETISGCTPAFTAMYLEALGDAGVKYGLTRAMAYNLVAQMLKGTGALYLEQNEHPGKMKDNVCSPSGSTIRGVEALEEHGFRYAAMAAINAAHNKK